MNHRVPQLIAGRVMLVLFMAATAIPFLSLFTTALAPQNTTPHGISWPSHPHWHNFVDAFHAADLMPLLGSSLLIVLGVVPVALALAAAAGYGLAVLGFPGARIVFGLLLVGLTVPTESLITPLYYQLESMGLLNTRWALVLPLMGLFMPFSVVWMRTFYLSLPKELTEAASVDGAGPWTVFRRVHLPLARPALSSLAILLFLWTWNQFLLAIALIDDPAKRTVAGALGAFQGHYGTNVVLLSAGSLLIMLPAVLVFVIFQRHFVTALLQGAVKG
ncbi:carbohydrate ABC transporter permease [Streptomyces shenzhenensis]|uniref:carbohydrate ABC transporter permease n=1 Tax=Streptomyces TaxID=1883 RepID=UPI001F35A6A3|nr:carbohydrate ABC transporter permease [Streptomyces shenzhenensis]